LSRRGYGPGGKGGIPFLRFRLEAYKRKDQQNVCEKGLLLKKGTVADET